MEKLLHLSYWYQRWENIMAAKNLAFNLLSEEPFLLACRVRVWHSSVVSPNQ
jgi:hypothetical protein